MRFTLKICVARFAYINKCLDKSTDDLHNVFFYKYHMYAQFQSSYLKI